MFYTPGLLCLHERENRPDALVRKIDGAGEEIKKKGKKEAETLCKVTHRTGTAGPKEAVPVHFRWTSLIFHYNGQGGKKIHPPTYDGARAKWKPILNIHPSLK